MKKYCLLTLMMSLFVTSFAQESEKKESGDKPRVTVYGFVRNYFNYDSRNTVTVCGGEYNIIPYDEDWNITPAQEAALSGATLPEGSVQRFDRNATPQTHFLALSSRFGIAVNGPKVLGAATSGKLEGDFAGFGTTNTVLRLRLAYFKMDWNDENTTHTLVAGQDWHPLSGDIMPDVLGMAAGAPFRPHSRTPQLRYQFQSGSLCLMATALYQYQFTSPGPGGENASYANQSLIPELFFGAGYRDANIYAQLGIDYLRLTVRESMSALPDGTTVAQPYLFKGDCHAFSPTLYFQYLNGPFALKMRSTIAQNLAHLNMISGYARTIYNGDLSTWHYMPLRASVTYLNVAYGRTWRVNLLLGYQKNLGVADGYTIDGGAIYMKKGINNVNSIYRAAPSISYNTKAFNVGLEYEMTAATYGDLLSDGTVANNDNLHEVINHRICALIKYNF